MTNLFFMRDKAGPMAILRLAADTGLQHPLQGLDGHELRRQRRTVGKETSEGRSAF
jgi:hypothetical protein